MLLYFVFVTFLSLLVLIYLLLSFQNAEFSMHNRTVHLLTVTWEPILINIIQQLFIMRQEHTLSILQFFKPFYPCIALFQLTLKKKASQWYQNLIFLMECLMFYQKRLKKIRKNNFVIIIIFYQLKIMAKPKFILFCLLQPINLFNWLTI